jgi:hypothetical protein
MPDHDMRQLRRTAETQPADVAQRVLETNGEARRSACVLTFLMCVAMAAGCGHSSTAGTSGGDNTAGSAAAPSDSAEQAAANALKTTPLTQADIDLYIDIMKAAADKITNATGDDRAAIDLMKKINSGQPGGTVNPDQAALLVRGTQLAQIDEKIAAQRGVQVRYDAIRGVIEALVGPMVCTSCSGDGGTQAASAAQQQEWAAEEDVQKTDLQLLQPDSAEITSLQKQVRGFLTNQGGN